MNEIPQILKAMDIAYKELIPIRKKDGIRVTRILCDNRSFVLKLFERQELCREIENYKILASLKIPTPQCIAVTDNALLLEDICQSSIYRLGTEADRSDPRTAALIAQWYQQLHHAGYAFLSQNKTTLYDENDAVTLQNIAEIQQKTGTASLPIWECITQNFEQLRHLLTHVKRTLTYSDFNDTNLIVAKDQTSAMMFDYHQMGKGYAYADIRNVCYMLSPHAQKAFLSEYGAFDPAEAIIDDVASVLVTLHLACQKPQFPAWAEDALKQLHTNFTNHVYRMLSLSNNDT